MADQSYSNLIILKRFLPFVRPYKGKYIIAILLLILTSLLSLLPPILLKIIIDDALKNNNSFLLNTIVLVMVGIIAASGLSRGVMEYLHEWVSAWFIFDLRRHLFNHVQSQSMDFFSSEKIGEILGRLRIDITAVYGILVNTFLGALSEGVQVVGITILLFYLDYKLAIAAFLFIPPLYLVLAYTGKRLRTLSRATRDKDVSLLEFFQEKISNIGVIKLYHREQYEDENHTRLGKDFIEISLQRLRFKFFSIFVIGILTSLASVAIIWYGGHKVIEGTLSFGSLFAFYLYTVRLYVPIQSLANRGVEIANGLASADRLIDYLDMTPTIKESSNPIHLEKAEGRICFNNVSFQYPRSKSLVINNLSLEVLPGQKIAIVGPSGAGKTTLVNLLCRLYDPNSGNIEIDGHDVRELELNSLYDIIGIVSQDTYLFNSTIEENIRYGRINASADEVIEATKKAHLHEMILQMPDGYQTIIGSRGVKLSGGQRQRLALARMILKNSNIWILDEFTSSLDSSSEAIVYENIQPLLQNKTTLIIAHRFSTILSADQVVVLRKGSIVEMGTHSYLYQKEGFYRELFDKQLQKNDFFNLKIN